MVVHYQVISEYTAFDGMKNCYTTRPLKCQGNKFRGAVMVKELVDVDREIEITIDLKLSRTNIDLETAVLEYCRHGASGNIPQSEIQILDIVLSQVCRY